MNSIASVEILGPEGRTEACARFAIDDGMTPFVLKGVCVPGDEYVLGFWVKSHQAGRISAGGRDFVTGEEWTRCEADFTAAIEDMVIMFDAGEYFVYHAKLERGNRATDWSPAPEDGEEAVKEAYSRIELSRDEILLEVSDVRETLSSEIAANRSAITQTAERITSEVERLDGEIGGAKSVISQTAERITSEVERLDGEIGGAKSVISQTADDIRLEVKGAGGVNLIADSAEGASGTGYPLVIYRLNEAVEDGETVTFTIWDAELGSGKTGWALYDNSGIYGHASLQEVEEGVYSATFRFNGNGISTGLALYAMPGSVSAASRVGRAKLERGSRRTAWSASPLDPATEVEAGSTVLINREKVHISTPEFLVDIPTTQEMDVRVTDTGFEAPLISSPSVAKAMEGGIFTVGAGGDFASLSEAFGNISGRYIDGDITLKLLESSDAGGVVRGVSGPGRVIVAPVNLMNTYNGAAWTNNSATVFSMGQTGGVYMKANSAGASRYATLNLGYVGPLGIRGKTVTVSCQMYSGSESDPAYPSIAVICGDANWVWLTRDSSASALDWITVKATFTVPERMGYWDEFKMYFYMSVSQSVSTTAVAYFRSPRMEIGGEISALNTGCNCVTVNGIRIEGCTAQVCMHGLVFPESGKVGIEALGSAVSANRCTFKGAKGFMLWGGSGAMYNCYGACSEIAARAAGGGAMEIFGACPSGEKKGLVEISGMTGDAPVGDAPVESKVVTIKAAKTGTYAAGKWMTGDAAVRQGYTQANGRMKGGMWFDLSAVSGKTITRMTLRIRRVAGYGKGGNVDVAIYGTGSAALTGNPALSGTVVTGSIAPDRAKTFDITALKGYSGFVLYAADTTVMDGKTYSGNYARFTGTGGGEDTIPLLTVTYE